MLNESEFGAPMVGNEDTVFAAASGAGRAAVTLLRISGPRSGRVLDLLCGYRPTARRASLRSLHNRLNEVLDKALVLWLPGPGTYTGEDSAELHLHGGAAVLADVAAALVEHGLRPAEPGEFTRRAFMNGRIDLIEAEAVADLIEAETSAQRRQALRQLDGELGAVLGGWSVQLKTLLAQQEALIDFPDEDLPQDVEVTLLAELGKLHNTIAEHLDDSRRGERLRAGLVFAITGAPNVGKSSLINALSGHDVAIVAPSPGTTRDVIEVRTVLGGVPVTLLDTAGLRETSDDVEAEGVRRARRRAAEADLVIVLESASEPFREPPFTQPPSLRVTSKVDLYGPAPAESLGICAPSGEGIEALLEELGTQARLMTHSEGPPPLTRARHRAALMEARDRLWGARLALAPELRGEEMRLALRAIGRVTGQVGVEDILDSVFHQFCIGK